MLSCIIMQGPGRIARSTGLHVNAPESTKICLSWSSIAMIKLKWHYQDTLMAEPQRSRFTKECTVHQVAIRKNNFAFLFAAPGLHFGLCISLKFESLALSMLDLILCWSKSRIFLDIDWMHRSRLRSIFVLGWWRNANRRKLDLRSSTLVRFGIYNSMFQIVCPIFWNSSSSLPASKAMRSIDKAWAIARAQNLPFASEYLGKFGLEGNQPD